MKASRKVKMNDGPTFGMVRESALKLEKAWVGPVKVK